MKQETLLWIIILELGLLLLGLYDAAVTAQSAVANSPLGQVTTDLQKLGL